MGWVVFVCATAQYPAAGLTARSFFLFRGVPVPGSASLHLPPPAPPLDLSDPLPFRQGPDGDIVSASVARGISFRRYGFALRPQHSTFLRSPLPPSVVAPSRLPLHGHAFITDLLCQMMERPRPPACVNFKLQMDFVPFLPRRNCNKPCRGRSICLGKKKKKKPVASRGESRNRRLRVLYFPFQPFV